MPKIISIVTFTFTQDRVLQKTNAQKFHQKNNFKRQPNEDYIYSCDNEPISIVCKVFINQKEKIVTFYWKLSKTYPQEGHGEGDKDLTSFINEKVISIKLAKSKLKVNLCQ